MYYATAVVVVAGGAVGADGAATAAAFAVGGGGGGGDCVDALVNAADGCALVRLSVPLPLLLLVFVLVLDAALIVGIVALITFLPLPLLLSRFGCK